MLKKLNLFIIILSILFSSLPGAAQTTRQMEREKTSTTTTEKRIALVIGNSDYKNASVLPNPINDANDMAATLKDLGFEVISGTNQTKAQMQNLIRQFGTRLADTKAIGLFFYAGHGIAENGTNFLIPVDADIQAEDEIEESSVNINFVLNKMAAANNGFNMVILDACRNNPFARKWRNYRDIGDKGGLARIDAPTGTLIAYATKPGEVASDGTGRNGLYTGALLKQMRVKNIDVTKMLQNVRADVIKQSGGKQVPFDESSVVGDFYFAGLANPNPVVNSNIDRTAGETVFWKKIENSTDIKDFEDYLALYPQGIYAGAAQLSLRKLREKQNTSNSTTTTERTSIRIGAFDGQLLGSDKSAILAYANNQKPADVFLLDFALLEEKGLLLAFDAKLDQSKILKDAYTNRTSLVLNLPAAKAGFINTSAFDNGTSGITKYTSALNGLEQEFKPAMTELNALTSKYNNLVKEIQTLQTQKNADKTIIQNKIDEAAKLQREIEFKQEDAKAKYSKRYNELLGPIMQDISKALQQYAMEKGFSFLIDASKIDEAMEKALPEEIKLFSKAGFIDATNEFIKFYNAKK